MFVNLNIIAAVLIAAGLYYAGRFLVRRITGARARGVVVVLLAAGCLPSLMFLAYYLHLFGEPLWYIQWRSLPFTEVLSSLCAPLAGFISVRRPCLFPQGRGLLRLPVAALCALLVLVPYAKPILLPVSLVAHWSNQWRDGVCLQTALSTCGPASLATIFARYDMPRSEREIARASFSCASGTELWYLLRYARQQGLPLNCRHETRLAHIVVPALLGTGMGRSGHFIVLLDDDNGQLTIGDPLLGRVTMSEEEFSRRYQFSGCVADIHKP